MASVHNAGAGVVPPLLSARDALYLDFDGTLTDIAPRPDAVAIAQTLPPLIELTAICIIFGIKFGPGLVVAFWTTRGELITWRRGLDPSRLHGSPVGDSLTNLRRELHHLRQALDDDP